MRSDQKRAREAQRKIIPRIRGMLKASLGTEARYYIGNFALRNNERESERSRYAPPRGPALEGDHSFALCSIDGRGIAPGKGRCPRRATHESPGSNFRGKGVWGGLCIDPPGRGGALPPGERKEEVAGIFWVDQPKKGGKRKGWEYPGDF